MLIANSLLILSLAPLIVNVVGALASSTYDTRPHQASSRDANFFPTSSAVTYVKRGQEIGPSDASVTNTNGHLPPFTRPVSKIIDMYPRFGIQSGAPLPTTAPIIKPRRYDRVVALRTIQLALTRLGTAEKPPLFSKPIYTLGPDIPFSTFVNLVARRKAGLKSTATQGWLRQNIKEITDAVSGLVDYAMKQKNTPKKAPQDPTIFQEWYARLAHYGLVRSPSFHNQITYFQAFGKRIFRNAPLAWIPGYAQMDEGMRGDVAFLFHQLLLIRTLQLALERPELVTTPYQNHTPGPWQTVELDALDEECRRLRHLETKRLRRCEKRMLHQDPLRQPGQRGKDRVPRRKRMRLLTDLRPDPPQVAADDTAAEAGDENGTPATVGERSSSERTQSNDGVSRPDMSQVKD